MYNKFRFKTTLFGVSMYVDIIIFDEPVVLTMVVDGVTNAVDRLDFNQRATREINNGIVVAAG